MADKRSWELNNTFRELKHLCGHKRRLQVLYSYMQYTIKIIKLFFFCIFTFLYILFKPFKLSTANLIQLALVNKSDTQILVNNFENVYWFKYFLTVAGKQWSEVYAYKMLFQDPTPVTGNHKKCLNVPILQAVIVCKTRREQGPVQKLNSVEWNNVSKYSALLIRKAFYVEMRGFLFMLIAHFKIHTKSNNQRYFY